MRIAPHRGFRIRVSHRPTRPRGLRSTTGLLAFALALVVAGGHTARAGEACYQHQFLGDHPDEANPGWHQEAQGVSHDDDNWYAGQNIEACVLPEGHPLCLVVNSAEGCLLPGGLCDLLGVVSNCQTRRPGILWKFPITQDIADAPGAALVATVNKDVCDQGFNHLGGPSFHSHNGAGFVLAPLEGNGPAVAVWGANLADGMIDWAPLDPADSGQSSASWVAVDAQGLLWSGSHNESHLNRFTVDWDLLEATGDLVVDFLDQVPMIDENGQPLALASYEQGGDFADSTAGLPFPLLYMVNGDADDDCDCGIHVFEVRNTDTGEACGAGPGPCVARRVDQSANGSGDFSYAYDPGFSTYEEPEGLTFWDLDADPRAPNVGGQIHVVLLDNDEPLVGQGDDDVYVKHYRLETDDVAPSVACPADITVECTGNLGIEAGDPQLAPFFTGASASDVCDPDVAITTDAPGHIPLGSTLVTFTATDDFKNASTCTATITVQDTIAPEIAVELDPDVLWPPNHKMATIAATVEVTDVCDPGASFVLASATSSEPDNGLGDGDTAGDIQGADFGSADTSLLLRAERAGPGPGRVYTIAFTASDSSGNTTPGDDEVNVPHDQSGQAKAASGFRSNGNGFAEGATTFDLVIPSSAVFDARRIDVRSVQVGNTAGRIDALASRVLDANKDGRPDLVVRYAVSEAEILRTGGGLAEALALRYGTVDGVFYLVPDIFRLGASIGGKAPLF